MNFAVPWNQSGQRRLGDPRMQRADVIGHRIKEKFHLPLSQFRGQLLVVTERPQVRIDRVEIRPRRSRDNPVRRRFSRLASATAS